MGQFFKVLGVIFLGIIIAGVIGFAVVAYQGTKLDKSSKAYVDRVAPIIISSWNLQELMDHASPELLKMTPHDKLDSTFKMFSEKLGTLKEYKGSEGSSLMHLFPTVITAKYIARATFEKGNAEIRISIIRHNKKWQLVGFYVDSKAFMLASAGEVNGEIHSGQQLEEEVNKLLQSGNVELRRNVGAVFAFAKLCEQQGKIKKAIELYDKALEVNAWNLEYQLRLAYLLKDTNRKQESLSKAQLVSDYAEDEALINDAGSLLASMGVTVKSYSKSPEVNKAVEIVLIPLGNVSMKVLGELQHALEETMGIHFSTAKTKKDIGKYDRDMAQSYINSVFASMISSLPPALIDKLLSELKLDGKDLDSQDNKIKFINAYFEQINKAESVKEKKTFDELLLKSRSEGQYDADRLLREMRSEFPVTSGVPIKGYLAVTGEDIYAASSHFLFGNALPGYGVISYHRFAAIFNKENQNRPRLIKRSLKQAVTSSFFILGIPRCSDPMCIRAYPHSLEELDEKGDKICSSCLSRLKEYQNK